MQRVKIQERDDWKKLAQQLGFKFHTIEGEPYWDESAYYRFTLAQVENDIEDPSAEIHAMCLDLVDRAVSDERLLEQLRIPKLYWDHIRESWLGGDKQLYGRMDFSYNGHAPAKFYEYNADTPTSLYESAFFQWVWLEQCIERGLLPVQSDQFNAIQEHLIATLAEIDPPTPLYFACCKDTEEDRGTVQYMEDCAVQAGLKTKFIYVEDIGISADGQFTDNDDYTIPSLFKLYPWEFMMAEEFGPHIPNSQTWFLEPAWKALLSNKGILPLLWELYPNHPNLLEAYFEGEVPQRDLKSDWVRKPLFSREGSNISVMIDGNVSEKVDGPYDDGGYILQRYSPPATFGEHHTIVGSWIVADRAVGMSIREDSSVITKDTSRFIPHIILD